MFVLLCAGAYAVYTHRDMLRGSSTELLPEAKKDQILDRIRQTVDSEACYVALRGTLNWRPNEQRYRLDFTVRENCDVEARRLCREVAEIIREEAQVVATVIAYDDSGREVAREVL